MGTRESAAVVTNPRRDAPSVALRTVSAFLVAAMGVIHLYLWISSFRDVPVIGALFLVNAVGSGVLAAALVGAPRRLLGAVAVVSALFTGGTLAALLLSMVVGLFGYRETGGGLVVPTIIVEAAGVGALVALAARQIAHTGQRSH
jgi:hypothetical protein